MSNLICQDLWQEISSQVHNRFIFGQEDTLRYCLVAYLANGHVLLEGSPGTGKTVTARLLSRILAKSFSRIQFTSDLLPADIIGSSIYSPKMEQFEFIRGPIFADFVLADEVNRTPPRTQSALLEAMEERQVTTEGTTYKLSPNFFVIATQNPREFEGTFPLPEAQLDRFLLSVVVKDLPEDQESLMLDAALAGSIPPPMDEIFSCTYDQQSVEQEISKVKVDTSITRYITAIVAKSRTHPMLDWGSSFRGGLALAKSSRVLALTCGRDFVIPDDIQELAPLVLRHRIKLTPEAIIGDVQVENVISEVIEQVPFPR
jgi:MoxR-like ATPase